MRHSWMRCSYAERGAALLSLMLSMLIITVVTVGVMGIVQGDLAAGIRQQQAMQVFNTAEAGIHYAIARMQTAGAQSYAGETVGITDGATVIGQAAVVVQCLDGTTPTGTGCATNGSLRRVRSTGSLAVAGPQRLVVAIVEGTTSPTSSYAICGYDGVNLDQGVTVYGDVGTNQNLSLARGGTPSRICNSTPGGACAAPVPAPPFAYSGSSYAVGTITCAGGSCNSTQIEGTIAPNQPAGSVCPTVTLTPPSGPGTTNLTVPAGSTVTVDAATNYGNVVLSSPGGGAGCPPVGSVATLVIDSGNDPTATVTIRVRTLWVGRCARVVITGVGKVALWLLEPTTVPAGNARQALKTEQQSVFGSTAIGAPAVPIEGGRFTINVMSSKPVADAGDCLDGGAACAAVHFNRSGTISGTFVIPYGGFELDQAQLTNGAVLAQQIQFDRDTTFYYDPTSQIGSMVVSNFNRLRSWKDQ